MSSPERSHAGEQYTIPTLARSLHTANSLTRLSADAKKKRIHTQVGPFEARMLSACPQHLSFIYEHKLTMVPVQAKTFQGEKQL